MYEQQFDLPGIGRKTVKGFIGAVRLHDYAEGRILPHEKVLTGPLEDRIRLTEATNTQFEYIWSLYQDRAYVIDNILDEQETRARHRRLRRATRRRAPPDVAPDRSRALRHRAPGPWRA